MKNFIFILIMTLSLTSCSDLLPKGMGLGNSESNSNMDSSTSQVQAQAGVSLAGKNANTSNYRNSNIKSQDSAYDSDTTIKSNHSRNALNIADNVLDKSLNVSKTSTLTKSNNKENSYSAESIIFNHAEDVVDKVLKVINNGFQLILMMIAYSVGVAVSKRRERHSSNNK